MMLTMMANAVDSIDNQWQPGRPRRMPVDVEFVRQNEDADQFVSLCLRRGEQVLFVMVLSK